MAAFGRAIDKPPCWLLLASSMLLLLFHGIEAGQWLSRQAVQQRFPGCCPGSESFDCGDGKCLSVSRFHDGNKDCADGSDEFCLPGQIQCGQFCADLLHLGECLRNPNCTIQDENSAQPPPPLFCPLLKRRLCGVANTISCRGYGECIFIKWLLDGKRDCLDGSDEDAEYASLFKLVPEEAAEMPQTAAATLPTLPTLFPPLIVETSSKTAASTTLPPWEAPVSKMSTKQLIKAEEGKEWTSGGKTTKITQQAVGHGLRLVESTQPGPWESPPLDDFGGEFARELVTPTPETSTRQSEATTTKQRLITGAAGRVEDLWVIFPGLASTQRPTGSQRMPFEKVGTGREDLKAPQKPQSPNGPSIALKEGAPGINLLLTTPKYPFDRGKAADENLAAAAAVWVPVPFSRPERPSPKPTARPSSKITAASTKLPLEAGTTMRGAASSGRWIAGSSEVWKPEAGKEEAVGREEEVIKIGWTTIPEAATTEEEEAVTEEAESVTTESSSFSPVSTMETGEAVAGTASSAAGIASTSQLQQASSHTPSPIFMANWMPPFSPIHFGSALATVESQPGWNCSERMAKMVEQLLPPPLGGRCACPVGQMQQIDGKCRPVPVSTFRVRLDAMCSTKPPEQSPLMEQLALLKLAASLPGQPVCIRSLLGDEPVAILNGICEAECTVHELAAKMKDASTILPELKVRVGELTDGACSQFDLNDCDEKAECTVEGLRYRCRCLPGTNDTTPDGSGRTCEGTVISQNCTKLLGVCVLVWILMLLLLCFLLPILAFLCYKHCCETPASRDIVERRWRWVKAKILGKERTLLPTITTSAAPSSTQRRESGFEAAGGTQFLQRGDTLQVPSIMEGGQKPFAMPFRQPTQGDSEDYLILEEEDEEAGEEVEEREQPQRESTLDKGEEESGGPSGKGTRQQTEQSNGTLPTQKSVPEDTRSLPAQPTARDAPIPSVPEVAAPVAIQQVPQQPELPPRPPSVASRAGTPTIWDQFRILGDQYTRLADIEERRESKNSLEELIAKRQSSEKPPPEPADELAERMKDELDAELKLREQKEDSEPEAPEMAQPERRRWVGGADEPGRSIPAPPGIGQAVNIGFGFPEDDIDIPSRIPIYRDPQISTETFPRRHQFVPKRPLARKPVDGTASEPRISSGSTVVKGPARRVRGEPQAKPPEFVLIKGRTVKPPGEKISADERRRRYGASLRRKVVEEAEKEEAISRSERMRRLHQQRAVRDELEASRFDPDLPSTSQAAQRQQFHRHPHQSAAAMRQHFHQHHGRPLHDIEEQIEERVHTGCIISGRKPWDVSPRADPLDWMPPLRRELSYSEDGDGPSREHSFERLESRVHEGCIKDRKPWDPSPYRDRQPLPVRGHSEWELERRSRGRSMERHGERRRPQSLERRRYIGSGQVQNWLDLD